MTSEVKYSYKDEELVFINSREYLEELVCPICHQIVFEPRQTNCGHLYCKKCLDDCSNDQCPVCRQEYKASEDHYNRRRVNGLKVKCKYQRNGCLWVGDLGDFAAHLERCKTTCPYCNVELRSTLLSVHVSERCPKRPIVCPYCNVRLSYDSNRENRLRWHYLRCQSFTHKCPNKCGGVYSFQALGQHIAKDCTEVVTICKYSAYGCSATLKRKDLSDHLDSRKDEHMQMVLQVTAQLADAYRSLSAKLESAGALALSTSQGLFPADSVVRPWLYNSAPFASPPWVCRMDDFRAQMQAGKICYGPPIHYLGYRFCLRIDANGIWKGKGKEGYVSVFICMMQGEFDDSLPWPFLADVTVQLLNQVEDKDHYTKVLYAHSRNKQVTGKERNKEGFGLPMFIAHSKLTSQYLRHNCLYFAVESVEIHCDLK